MFFAELGDEDEGNDGYDPDFRGDADQGGDAVAARGHDIGHGTTGIR